MSLAFDATAMGSDVPRSFRQSLMRRAGRGLVAVLGLNRPGAFSTEVVQSINPIVELQTRHGLMRCVGGHGRLVWRAESFHEEEPETVAWLDELGADDVLWDVGANVGMYAVYAARFAGARVFAFEPEAQNYALLIENIALNGVGRGCIPVNLPLSDRAGFGYLDVRYVTKGGAYNHFADGRSGEHAYAPETQETRNQAGPVARQLLYGSSIDRLLDDGCFAFPTHLKIDVDGLEAAIIAGASATLHDQRLKSILIEINQASEQDMAVPGILRDAGFELVSNRSNWEFREDRSREAENPTTNMIFRRA